MCAHLSDSAVQRRAELLIVAKVAQIVGCELSPARLALPAGAVVQVDGVSADESVLVEAFARQGALKGGQKRKVSQDALKLITLRRARPEARLVLAFADSAAAQFALAGTWVAEALDAWGVEVLIVELTDVDRAAIRQAQKAQIMLSPVLDQQVPSSPE